MEEKSNEIKQLDESAPRPMNKVDFLIKTGLGDKDRLYLYRKVIANPSVGVTDPILRPILAEVADQLLDLIFSDNQLWIRLYTLLQRQHGSKREREDLKKSRSWLSEEHGAGEVGTPELTAKYAAETPGQEMLLVRLRKVLKGRYNEI